MKRNVLQRLALASLATAALAGALAGCVPLVVGGAAVGSALVVTDRRTSGAQLEDEGIELRSANRIREALGERVHVNVTSYNRQVLLTGEVPNAQDKERVEEVVKRVENVRSIVNDLGVVGISSLSQRSNDVLTTGKVKAALVDAKDVQATSFKVVTERGTTYLMGRVSQREANRATDIARGVGGVAKVVRVFEYLTEEELARIGTQAPSTAPATAKP